MIGAFVFGCFLVIIVFTGLEWSFETTVAAIIGALAGVVSILQELETDDDE